MAAMVARPATPGKWCDFSIFPTLLELRALRAAGYIGCFCYVPLPGVSDAQKSNDITAERLQSLTGEGFEVGLIQHVRYSGWDPRDHSGTFDAAAAAEHALSVGYPTTAHIWNDLEGIRPGCSDIAMRVFLESWSGRMPAYPYGAGLYVGYQQPLTAEQLYLLHTFDTYGSDAGHRKVETRGVSFQQGLQTTVGGAQIDSDELAADLLGGLPIIAAAA